MNKVCSFETCNRFVKVKGMCRGHYGQHVRGVPLKPLQKRGLSKYCAFNGCDNVRKNANGLCTGHNWQVIKGHGLSKLGGKSLTKGLTDIERFWFYVDKSDDCWLWQGTTNGDDYGYGTFYLGGGRKRAHVFAYEITFGEVPSGLVVDHQCRTKLCVRPDHLRVITQGENLENHSGARIDSKTGVRGVSWSKTMKKWSAEFMKDGVRHKVGYFENIEEAEREIKKARNAVLKYNDLDRT